MGARMARGLAVAVVLGAAVRVAPVAAFTMAEQVATTGVHGALTSTSAPSASRTIGSVKNKLSASAPKLSSVRPPSGPGAGSPRGKRSGSSKSGWGDAAKGWAKSGAKGGKGGGGTWAGKNGAWAESKGWVSGSKEWSTATSGGGWTRPGRKS